MLGNHVLNHNKPERLHLIMMKAGSGFSANFLSNNIFILFLFNGEYTKSPFWKAYSLINILV
jgi:hypothetical protein